MATIEQNDARTRNLCMKLDQYQYKYAPVRVQAMIGDTLRASLKGEAKRNHDLYDHDKLYLLYRMILTDEGAGDDAQTDIERAIIQLNDRAKQVIEEEEKRKRRKPGAQRIVETPNAPDGEQKSGEVSMQPSDLRQSPKRDTSGPVGIKS